jgi:nucleotide-binding universal stress UspA family protein
MNGEARELVVVGVDGSEESIAALSWAARYANAINAQVRVVAAWHYPAAAGIAPVGVAPEPVREQAEQYVREQLNAAIAKVYPGSAADRVDTKLAYGHPAQVLLDESGNADLLVVGHRGRGAFTGMLVGSVSTHCVTHATCPVVVVRTRP